MANKEKIALLLRDIETLQSLVVGMQDAEIYPASFFEQTFGIGYRLLQDLHAIEAEQLEELLRQMEAHQALIQSVPISHKQDFPMVSVSEEPIIAETPAIPAVEAETETEEVIEALQPEEEPILDTTTDLQPEEESSPVVVERNANLSVSDLIEKKNLSDFRKAFSLNDRFRFKRELFAGNEELMNQTIGELNMLTSYPESWSYIQAHFQWNPEDEAVADFIKLLEKRFL